MDAVDIGTVDENIRLTFEAAVLHALRNIPPMSAGAAEGPSRPQAPLFVAALSGGADSTALTAALSSLCALTVDGAGWNPFCIRAVHVNHGIRPPEECAADEAACTALCERLGVPLAIRTVPPGRIAAHARERGTGMEAAARRFRYAALRDEARRAGAAAILTAHTRDDLLETILMAFLRGAGPSGLGAMQGRAPCPGPRSGAAAVPLIRPLLGLDRAGVLAYLAERDLPYRDDSSNADERFLRNRVRRRLIPFLDREFSRWRDPVRRLGETQALTAAFLAEEAAKLSPEPEDGALRLPAEDFFSRPEIVRETVLFAAIDELDSPLMETKKPRLEALRRFASGEAKAQDLGPVRLERDGGFVRVLPPLPRK